MTHDAVKLAQTNAATYQSESERDSYTRGFERGYNVASWQDIPEIGAELWLDSEGKITVDVDNLWDTIQSLAYQGESNDRSFSPFEFTAHEFNEADNAEGLWEAFDAGISAGIEQNLAERKALYVPDEPEPEPEPAGYVDVGLCCDTCVQGIANDDYSGCSDDEESATRAGIWQHHEVGHYLIVGDEQGFSWQACDICGALAGDRHKVGYMEPKIR
jgi:hypothetical protein